MMSMMSLGYTWQVHLLLQNLNNMGVSSIGMFFDVFDIFIDFNKTDRGQVSCHEPVVC